MNYMHELWAASKVGAATSATMAIVGNIEGQNISVTVALTCSVFIAGIVWWLASRFQKIADTQDDLSRRLKSIEETLNRDDS